jgi:hypothetical protein
LLFVADVIHTARECPGIDSDNFRQFIRMVSEQNLGRTGIRFVSAYVDRACLTGLLGRDHRTSLMLDAGSAEKIEQLFKGLHIEVRDVLPWKEVAHA